MKNFVRVSAALSLVLGATACGSGQQTQVSAPVDVGPPVGVAQEDGAVVKGRATLVVSSGQDSVVARLFQRLLMPLAYAASGSTTVTYTNVASTKFAIDATALAAGSMNGSTLSLGSVSVSSLSDNNLDVCGTGGTTRCSTAVIRVYNTGTTAGFVNTAKGYGAPVYAGTVNPSTALGLNAAGSVQVETFAIPSSKNVVNLSNFPSPTYSVSSDFSNAGAGNYSMTLVVEYALLP